MRAMAFSDLITMKGTLLQLLGIALIVSLFIAFMTGQLVSIAGGVAAMVPFIYLFNISACDEQNGWERFRLTMPISRKQVAMGRYVGFLIVTMASAMASLAFSAIVGSLAQMLPEGLAAPEIRLDAWSFPELAATGLMAGLVVLVAAAFTLPVFMRFGMTKGARFVPVVIVIALSAAIGFFGDSPDVLALEQLLASTEGVIFALAALTAIVLALYGASAAIAARLYETREL